MLRHCGNLRRKIKGQESVLVCETFACKPLQRKPLGLRCFCVVHDQFTDRISQLIKFFFIFCHNIIRCRPVSVEIIGYKVFSPSTFCCGFQGEIKKRAVIRFKLNTAIGNQDLVITCQKLWGCETSPGMSVFWPWVLKIQIDSFHFPLAKIFREIFCIHP